MCAMNISLIKMNKFARQLLSDNRGLWATEFAIALPATLMMGMGGIEVSNLSLRHLRVSQVTTGLADNVSRIGESSALSVKKIYESDINDSLQAAKLQGAGIDLTTNGRIIVSSLTRNASDGQWIQWQRCLGTKNVASSYGLEGAGATGTGFPGMGKLGKEIQAPPNSAVIFVEVVYDYKPFVPDFVIPLTTIRYTSAFIVRDQRDLTQIYNSVPAKPKSSCSSFSA
jgi:Flp pilus assembly protein TadG